jgi:hypothetical protein
MPWQLFGQVYGGGSCSTARLGYPLLECRELGMQRERRPLYCSRSWEATNLLFPPVLIGDAHNVVLGEVTADLDLDQLKRNLSRIAEPMQAANRNVH